MYCWRLQRGYERDTLPQSLAQVECVGGNQCPEEDSNLQGILLPLAPQASASANSATWAGCGSKLYSASLVMSSLRCPHEHASPAARQPGFW